MDREVVGGQETARAVAGDRSWIGGRSWETGAGQCSRRGHEWDRKVLGDRSPAWTVVGAWAWRRAGPSLGTEDGQ